MTNRSEVQDEELARAAVAALQQAYAPYSRFRVGAALLAEDGRIFGGCNVENASFGLTCCAERTALFSAVAAGARAFRAIAIATELEKAVMPCGACRQALAEFAPRLRVLTVDRAGRRHASSLEALLPDSFGPQDLRASALGPRNPRTDAIGPQDPR